MATQEIDISAIETGRSYTVKEVAALVQYTQVYLRERIRSGNIASFKPMGANGNIRIRGEEVRRLVASVNNGSGLSGDPSSNDADEIEVAAELAMKIMPGGVADPETEDQDQDQDEDSGEGGAFRHLMQVK